LRGDERATQALAIDFLADAAAGLSAGEFDRSFLLHRQKNCRWHPGLVLLKIQAWQGREAPCLLSMARSRKSERGYCVSGIRVKRRALAETGRRVAVKW